MLLQSNCRYWIPQCRCMSTELAAGDTVEYNGKQYVVVSDAVDGKVELSREGLTGSFIVSARSTILNVKETK